MLKHITPAALALLLVGCGSNDNDPGPGGITVGEARALDEAAAMVEERQLGRKPKAGATAASPSPDAPKVDEPAR